METKTLFFRKQSVAKNILADKVFFIVIVTFSFFIVLPLVLILGYIFIQGISHISIGLLVNDQRNKGILNAIVGSFIVVAIATIIAVPAGILSGIYLAENRKNKLADLVRISVDVLQGVPSIVMGIIAYVWIVVPLRRFSALAGGLALAIMMLPVIIKNTEETLALVPHSLKEAAYALGVPYHKVILGVVLPAGASGVITGVLVAVARVLGETAPLLFTAFGSRDLVFDIGKPMETLPPLIYKYATSPVEEWVSISWAASLILVVIVLMLNLITKAVMNKWKLK
jgi:phosphate transport system permease protein